MHAEVNPAKSRFLVGIVCLCLAVLSCEPPIRREVHLTLLSINDFHGALESTRKDRDSGRLLGGGAALATAINRKRLTNPEGTLLLDAGDTLHGTALSNLTEGRAVIEFLNLVGLDAAAVGNHEFDWGVGVLLERMEEANFPFLVANMTEKSTGTAPQWAKPYEVFEVQGVRVAVIGLSTVSTPETTLPSYVRDYDFLDPASIANRLVEEILPGQADLVVLLCHLGLFWGDGESSRGELAQVAKRVNGVAAIVAGHTHQLFAGKLSGIPTVEALASGAFLGRIDLVFDVDHRKVLSSQVRTQKILADSIEPDPDVEALVARYREDLDDLIQQVIGEADSAIARRAGGESAMGNLVVDGWHSQVDADFVFQNPGGIRSSFEAGPITFEDLYRVMPFDNTVVTVQMSGAEIETLLEQAVEENRFLEVAGLRYSVDRAQPVGSRVTITPPLEAERTYEVSINSFMAEGGDGLTILDRRPEARDTGLLQREILAEWIRGETAAGRKIQAKLDGRIEIR